MLVEKYVTIKWIGSTKSHFQKKGYLFTKYLDEFEVKVEDLTDSSEKMIKVMCDGCGINIDKRYYSYKRSKVLQNKEDRHLDFCKHCTLERTKVFFDKMNKAVKPLKVWQIVDKGL